MSDLNGMHVGKYLLAKVMVIFTQPFHPNSTVDAFLFDHERWLYRRLSICERHNAARSARFAAF